MHERPLAKSRMLSGLLVCLCLLGLLVPSSCVSRPGPEAAVERSTKPPWDAPRDAVSYIDQAGLKQLPLSDNANPRTFTMTISIDGVEVMIPANIGVDRVRAIQAPVHTHDDSGQVWLEGAGNAEVTLGQFFKVWGVRFTDKCLGAQCGKLRVIVDGEEVSGDPREFVLSKASKTVELTLHS